MSDILKLANKNIISWTTDVKDIITHATPAFCRLLNKSKDEIVDKSIFDLFPKEFASYFQKNNQIVCKKNESVIDIELSHREDGSLGRFIAIKTPHPSIHGSVLGFAIDITDYLREKKFQEIAIKNAGVGFWSVNLSDFTVSWDQSMFDLYRLDPKNFSSHVDAWKSAAHPDDHTAEERKVREAAENDTAYDSQFRIKGPNNSWRYIKANAVILKEEGCPDYMIGTNWDITNLIVYQEKLAQKDKLSTLGLLSSGVAHEINSPLTIALGKVRKIRKNISKSNLDRDLLARDAELVAEALDRIQNIVGDLRNFSKIDKEPYQVFDVHSVILKIFEVMNFKSTYQDIFFDFQLDQKTLYAFGSPRKFEQVIVNLITNAVAALEINKKPKRVVIQSRLKKRLMLVEVLDNGIGIDEKDSRFLFDPFFTTKKTGTGLGLSISHGIIESFGGSLSAHPNPKEKGACFRIELPIAEPEERNSKDNKLAFKKLQIKALIIDDDIKIADILKDFLEEFDICVDISVIAEEAVEMARRNSYDLIISDFKMPERNGVEVLRDIKNFMLSPKPILCICSGGEVLLEDSDIQTITKPFDEAEITKLIEDVKSHLNFSIYNR